MRLRNRIARLLVGDPTSAEIQELLNFQEHQWKPRLAELIRSGDPTAAGGLYYHDSRVPFSITDDASVTLASTAKALWTTAEQTPTYKTDWFLGKRFHLSARGRMTTAATPGNLTVSVAYGTADNTGLLSTSAALTLVASQTNITWNCEAWITCRAIGASGSLLAIGVFETSAAIIASTGGPIPGSAPTAATVDLTATSGLNFQMARSGSTAETAQVHDKILTALN